MAAVCFVIRREASLRLPQCEFSCFNVRAVLSYCSKNLASYIGKDESKGTQNHYTSTRLVYELRLLGLYGFRKILNHIRVRSHESNAILCRLWASLSNLIERQQMDIANTLTNWCIDTKADESGQSSAAYASVFFHNTRNCAAEASLDELLEKIASDPRNDFLYTVQI